MIHQVTLTDFMVISRGQQQVQTPMTTLFSYGLENRFAMFW